MGAKSVSRCVCRGRWAACDGFEVFRNQSVSSRKRDRWKKFEGGEPDNKGNDSDVVNGCVFGLGKK